jgi:hypothetical protein
LEREKAKYQLEGGLKVSLELSNFFSKLSHIAPCLKLLLNDGAVENNEMHPGSSIISARPLGKLFAK